MSASLRIGLIGLDTSHVVAFTKLLNDPSNEHHVPNGKVVIAFPGGSDDFELSYSRVEGFTNEQVAQVLGCTTRSVERKLARIRDRWTREDDL